MKRLKLWIVNKITLFPLVLILWFFCCCCFENQIVLSSVNTIHLQAVLLSVLVKWQIRENLLIRYQKTLGSHLTKYKWLMALTEVLSPCRTLRLHPKKAEVNTWALCGARAIYRPEGSSGFVSSTARCNKLLPGVRQFLLSAKQPEESIVFKLKKKTTTKKT